MNSWAGKFRPVPHSFGDIVGQIPNKNWAPGDSFLETAAAIRPQKLLEYQYCHVHGGACKSLESVDVDFSGLPCQHNSRANVARLKQDGPFADVYMTWAKKHTDLATPLVILENTQDRQASSYTCSSEP